ncbi:hypothetical protein GsuE55_12550 [Geobacillus subterraneus]|uniref:Uncharacterized protein n=1 Tax=Geobacillus subterraneus TaxID=129338 RepID=A0A679FJ80_9BACL|nr:hypothetical protein GsuE55_12550 [Geobacillus subterraneus]
MVVKNTMSNRSPVLTGMFNPVTIPAAFCGAEIGNVMIGAKVTNVLGRGENTLLDGEVAI